MAAGVDVVAVGAIVAAVGGVVAAVSTVVRLVWDYQDRKQSAAERRRQIVQTFTTVEMTQIIEDEMRRDPGKHERFEIMPLDVNEMRQFVEQLLAEQEAEERAVFQSPGARLDTLTRRIRLAGAMLFIVGVLAMASDVRPP